ncbi:uncharacterized protein PADG_07169 [Paracoccidioides brasiliensis Pb18]|uniref:Uncharacterized protein n=2 Tax=Paracoccidioides brasiliensis TaxID=121759 RepID=C1GIT3_PARBD|nr:uncharacterized protein PADG_07169 [Paracoccidioides brasiliensis Pb18]EEH42349.1 hypothetical protein PADG_07169 [Paracoccidioides brasiliensis Pb18]ODH26151.1 hypothetical protein ACO22_04785 [Paracoccidioides brasiliensis]ODH47096.1 hypothetical protein GX48_06809 [Paracoccidioides brasiliensis]
MSANQSNPTTYTPPQNLSWQARQLLQTAYNRVLEARTRILEATDLQEQVEAHVRLAEAQDYAQQVRMQVFGTGQGQGQGNMSASASGRRGGHGDSDTVNVVEEAEEVDADEHFGRRDQYRPKPQPHFGSADLPMHPPLVSHMRLKVYLRERRHASLSVLTNQELLMNHAVANYETIPDTRRRFQHHYIGLNMPENYRHAFALQGKFLKRKEMPMPVLPTSSATTSTPTNSSTWAAIASSKPTSMRHIGAPPAATSGASTTVTGIPMSSYSNEKQLPIVDILEVDGGWQNKSDGDDGRRSAGLSASADNAGVSDGGGSGDRSLTRRSAKGRGAGASGSGRQGMRRSARLAGRATGSGVG